MLAGVSTLETYRHQTGNAHTSTYLTRLLLLLLGISKYKSDFLANSSVSRKEAAVPDVNELVFINELSVLSI